MDELFWFIVVGLGIVAAVLGSNLSAVDRELREELERLESELNQLKDEVAGLRSEVIARRPNNWTPL
jgi:cell division protein FtsB